MKKALQLGFSNYGFIELWIDDYRGLEAYGDIELFGLFTGKLYG